MEAEQLERLGWKIRPTSLAEMVKTAQESDTDLKSQLLNVDLREGNDFVIRENFVLQFVSMRNIAKPEQQEGEERDSKRRLMMIMMTDGRSSIQCLDHKGVASLPSEMPPGTKIQLKSGSVRQGIILLEAGSLKVLGGHVPALVEEWEFQRHYGKQRPAAEEEHAPRFEQYDPRKPPPKIMLGSFSTTEMLSRSSEGTQSESGGSSNRTPLVSESKQVFHNRDAIRAKLMAELPSPSTSTSRPQERAHGRGRGRGKGRPNEVLQVKTLTLEEYEARQQDQARTNADEARTNADEALARELDAQLNLKSEAASETRAEADLMSAMFSYAPRQDSASSRPPRGRGRGRGRSRGRRGRGGSR